MPFRFSLLSDVDHVAGRLMGAEREPDERGFGYPRRISYLVDPDLIVREAYRVGRDETAVHADAVLTDLRRHLGMP